MTPSHAAGPQPPSAVLGSSDTTVGRTPSSAAGPLAGIGQPPTARRSERVAPQDDLRRHRPRRLRFVWPQRKTGPPPRLPRASPVPEPQSAQADTAGTSAARHGQNRRPARPHPARRPPETPLRPPEIAVETPQNPRRLGIGANNEAGLDVPTAKTAATPVFAASDGGPASRRSVKSSVYRVQAADRTRPFCAACGPGPGIREAVLHVRSGAGSCPRDRRKRPPCCRCGSRDRSKT